MKLTINMKLRLVPEKYYNMSVFGSEWSLEAGYSRKDRDVFNYPFRALLSGTSYAFQIIMLQKKTSGDYNCGKLIQGYKVSIILLHASWFLLYTDHFACLFFRFCYIHQVECQ